MVSSIKWQESRETLMKTSLFLSSFYLDIPWDTLDIPGFSIKTTFSNLETSTFIKLQTLGCGDDETCRALHLESAHFREDYVKMTYQALNLLGEI